LALCRVPRIELPSVVKSSLAGAPNWVVACRSPERMLNAAAHERAAELCAVGLAAVKVKGTKVFGANK
jgi:hypothetical protein